MTTVVVSGAVANKHGHGGSLWVRMSWAEGLKKLGFEVVFVEELHEGGSPDVFEAVMRDLEIPAALIDGDRVIGMTAGELHERLDEAALLVNLSGHLRRPDLLRRVRQRVFVDLDPGYTQIWHAQGHDVGLADHHLHFTVGANVGTRALHDPDRRNRVAARSANRSSSTAGRRATAASRPSAPSRAGVARSVPSAGTAAPTD